MTRPVPFPEVVRNGSSALKIVYLYLRPLGTVTLTRRALAALLGVSVRPVSESFGTLARAGLLEYEGARVPRKMTPYHIKKP